MISLDVTQIRLEKLITHYVGNKLREEDVKLSDEQSSIENETEGYLLKYFLQPLNTDELYKFFHTVNIDLNEIYNVLGKIFDNKETFVDQSKNVAKLLYEYSNHPKIKGGELNVVMFDEVILNDEVCSAIGIFKTENHSPFLKMDGVGSKFNIKHEFGMELKSMDKGCLIINTNKEDGYKILLANGINRAAEAQYWKEEFLKIKVISDSYNYTKDLLTITKNFVTKQLSDNIEVTKTEKIDILNRSMDYFKTHENFVRDDFEKEVFQESNVISSFRNFDQNYRDEKEISLNDNFSISQQAVKKQSKIFKSVLKLDRNFDIYIHGSKDLIEQGVEKDGRKYYKIYYDEEK
jgi:hypothetical protein